MPLIENALVVLWDGKRAYWGLTDSNGNLQLKNVIAGTYKYVVYKDGYRSAYGEITVDADKIVNVTIGAIPPYYFTGVIDQELILSAPTYEISVFTGQDLSLSIEISYEVEVT